MKARTARALLTGGLAVGLLLASAPAAPAYHHVVMVSEVYPGDTAQPEEEFVELQMFAAGQNILSGLHVRLYDTTGNEVYEDEFPGTVPNGNSQATALSGVGFFTPELLYAANPSGYLNPAGGAACITSDVFTPSTPLDCVAWGSFSDTAPPMPVVGVGTPEAAIPDALSISRTHGRGCATLLEGVDDSNNSDADFSATEASPRNNAAPITEVPCGSPPPPGGGGSATPVTPAPKKKKKCKKAKKRSVVAARKCKRKK